MIVTILATTLVVVVVIFATALKKLTVLDTLHQVSVGMIDNELELKGIDGGICIYHKKKLVYTFNTNTYHSFPPEDPRHRFATFKIIANKVDKK